MTDTNHNVGIRIDGDASGAVAAGKQFGGGLDELRRRAEALGVDLKKVEQEVAKVTSTQAAYNTILAKTLDAEIKYAQGLGRHGQATREASDETKRFVERLKEKAETLGKTRAQTEAYRAAQLGLTDAQKASVATSVKQIEAYDEHEKAMGRLKVAGAIAGAAAIAYATSTAIAVKGIIDEADQLGKLSQSLGISTEGLSAYRHQTSMAGISNQEFATAMRALSKNVAEAQSGVGDGARLFRLLGAEAEQAAKRGAPLEELLPKIAEAFARFRPGPNLTEFARALFGHGGDEMIRMLSQGAAGFTAAAREAAEFKRIVGPDFARQSEEFNDNLRRMNALLDVQKQILARELVPSLNQYLNILIEVAKQKGGGLVAGIFAAGAAGGGTREEQIARLEAQRAKLMAPDADPDMRRIDLPYIERALAAARAQKSTWERDFEEQQRRYGQMEAPVVPKGGRAQASDFDRLIEQAERMDALATSRAESTEKLTAAERMLYQVQALYEAGLTTLNPRQFELLQTMLAQTSATQREVEQRERAAAAVRIASKEYGQSAQALDRESKQQEDLNAKLAVQNAEIGLTPAKLAAVRTARAEDALATARQAAALDQLRDSDDAYARFVQTRVQQAEEHLRLVREGEMKSIAAKTSEEQARQFKHDAESIERGLTDALMRGFEGGKDAARNFWDAMRNMAATTFLRPIIQPMMQPFGEAGAALARGIAQWARGSGGGGGIDGGSLGGAFDIWAGVSHAGGIPGVDRIPMRAVPALAFAGAPRLHSGGIATDEIPAILRRGEEVLTEDDPRHRWNGGGAAPNVTINVRNESGVQLEAQQVQRPRLDASGWVIDVILQRGSRDAGFREQLRSMLSSPA